MNSLIFDSYTIFWRELKRYKKSRSGVLIRLIQPAIWIIVIGNTFSGTQPLIQSVGFDGEYIEFMAPGVIILTAIFTSIFGGVNTLWDRRYGFMNKALTSPISRSAIALGKMSAISLIAALQASLILGIALAIGVTFSNPIDDCPNHGNCNFIFAWVLWNICHCCCNCKIPRNLLGDNQFLRDATFHAESCLIPTGIIAKLVSLCCKT